MPDSDIFRGYRAPNRELSLNLKKLSLNPHLSTDIDKQNELYGKVNIEIPNFRVYDNLFDIVNPINVSEEVLDDKNIKAIERFKESEELYNFNGVKISRRKVLRLYSTLMQNDKSDEMDALLYCITYGSMLDKNEYKVLNTDAVINETEIEKNNEIAAKKLEISNDIILYDLIKNEKNKLKRVNGE